MERYQIVLVEDERHASERLTALLNEYFPDFHILGVYQSLQDAYEGISNSDPDLLFLDIEIKGGTSFELLEKLPDLSADIIFTTAHESYAIKAFEYSAIHYLMKPIDGDDFRKAVGRFVDKKTQNEYVPNVDVLLHNINTEDELEHKMTVSTTTGITIFKTGDIERIQTEGNYCDIFLRNGDKLLVSKQLKHFEALLNTKHFFRSHQSHLVNFSLVEKFNKKSGTLVLKSKVSIPLATRKKEEFMKRIATFDRL